MPRFATLFSLAVLVLGLPVAHAQPIIVGNGDGFVEFENPLQDPCPDAGDPGCDLGLGNTVFNDPNITDDHYFSSTGTAAGVPPGGSVERLYRYIETLSGDKIAIVWTEEGSYGVEFPVTTAGQPVDVSTMRVVRVAFEIWAIGDTPHNSADDVRMIPLMLLDAGGVGAPDPVLVLDWFNEDPFVGFADDGSNLPATNAIYMMMPDRAGGYDLFEADAINAGIGNFYTNTDDDVMPIDPTHLEVGDISQASGNPCLHQNAYISWCYRNDQLTGIYPGGTFGAGDPDPGIDPNGFFVYPIGRVQVVDNDPAGPSGDTLPPVGTTNLIHTTGGEVIGVEPPAQPGAYALLPVLPNPFAAQARVAFWTPRAGDVRVAVYDALGREVAVLADGAHAAGGHEVTFGGVGLPAGLYVVVLEAEGVRMSRKVTLLP
jgi:hypothetical protein